jgi:hypothetical protein
MAPMVVTDLSRTTLRFNKNVTLFHQQENSDSATAMR